MTDTMTQTAVSALPPTKKELVAWRALSRDEQLARYREALQNPEAQRLSRSPMSDVLAAGRKRVAERRG
jgi:hypothetical protein